MMKTNPFSLGYAPPETMWGSDSMDDGFYSFNQNISRTLAGRDHLGYYPKAAPWGNNLDDFGYFSLNSGIAQALKKLSGHA
jgi:hypothetical protein